MSLRPEECEEICSFSFMFAETPAQCGHKLPVSQQEITAPELHKLSSAVHTVTEKIR